MRTWLQDSWAGMWENEGLWENPRKRNSSSWNKTDMVEETTGRPLVHRHTSEQNQNLDTGSQQQVRHAENMQQRPMLPTRLVWVLGWGWSLECV